MKPSIVMFPSSDLHFLVTSVSYAVFSSRRGCCILRRILFFGLVLERCPQSPIAVLNASEGSGRLLRGEIVPLREAWDE